MIKKAFTPQLIQIVFTLLIKILFLNMFYVGLIQNSTITCLNVFLTG